MKRVLINIMLLIVAILLLSTIGVFGLVYTLFYTLFNYKKLSFANYWGDFLYAINVGIDSIGNVLLGPFLNRFAIVNPKLYPFGNIHHTISHVLAVNHLFYSNTTPFGIWLVNTLDKLDKNHMNKSL